MGCSASFPDSSHYAALPARDYCMVEVVEEGGGGEGEGGGASSSSNAVAGPPDDSCSGSKTISLAEVMPVALYPTTTTNPYIMADACSNNATKTVEVNTTVDKNNNNIVASIGGDQQQQQQQQPILIDCSSPENASKNFDNRHRRYLHGSPTLEGATDISVCMDGGREGSVYWLRKTLLAESSINDDQDGSGSSGLDQFRKIMQKLTASFPPRKRQIWGFYNDNPSQSVSVCVHFDGRKSDVQLVRSSSGSSSDSDLTASSVAFTPQLSAVGVPGGWLKAEAVVGPLQTVLLLEGVVAGKYRLSCSAVSPLSPAAAASCGDPSSNTSVCIDCNNNNNTNNGNANAPAVGAQTKGNNNNNDAYYYYYYHGGGGNRAQVDNNGIDANTPNAPLP